MGLPKGAVLLLRLITGFIRMFVLDSRSLALFRVWIGATTIADVWTRFPDAHHHYSDSGMFPREFILKSFTNHYWITMHMLSGTEFVMQCLFIVEIFIAFLLLVGYRTRTMNILSWIMVCSVQNRNYVLGHSGDTVHRLFLFVGIFLPLSRVFSVDRVLECIRTSRDCDDLDRDREREKRRLGLAGLTSSPANGGSATSSSSSSSSCAKYEIVNFATALFIVQLLIMYYMAHHHKTGAEWREKGIAAWMALQLDYFRTWFGDLLLIWTPGLIFGNYAVLAWQYWGSVMYFSPIFNKYFRALTCLGFTAMHVGFGMAFYLETFTWATLAACSGIIPSWVWDLTIKFISNLPFFKPIQIHVTSNCKTCLFVARLLDEFSLPGKSKIIIASSRLSSSSSQSCLCSSKCSHGSRFLGISVLDQNKNWIQGPAALSAIAKNSPILYPLHFVLRIPFVQKILSFVSFATHSHNLEFSNSDSAMEEATIDTSKFSYRPHFESFEKFERDTKKDDDVLALPRNEEFVGVLVDSNSPNINTNTGKGKKEIFEVQSASYNWADVKEASKIGFIAGKEIFVALLLFLVITCNAGHLNNQYGVPPPLQPILWMFQLDQYWGMFAPRPPDITWWYNFEGYLDDGTHVELFNNGAMHSFSPNIPHTFDKPNIHDSIGNHRWFKLFENGLNSHSNREEIRLYFGRWFCREYNSRNKGTKRVHKYSIHFMYERLNLEKMDGSRFPPARESIWNHLCYEKDKN